MSIQYDPSKTNWWLSVGGSTVGDIHRSLTHRLLRDRWLACQVIDNARVAVLMDVGVWHPVDVRIMKDGEPQSGDII